MFNSHFYLRNVVIVFVLMIGNKLYAQSPPNFVIDVYNKMFSVMSSGQVNKPSLVYSLNQNEVATFSPHKGELRISEKLVTVARSFGKDSSNFIAQIIGHELVHILIQKHASIKEVGSGYASEEINDQMKGVNKILMDSVYERQADEFAGMYAHICGYKTTHIAERSLDSIYKAFNLKDKDLKRYPKLTERKLIARHASKRMALLNNLFDYAVISSVSGNQDVAIGLYESIIDNGYTGKEVFNNLGTSYLLKALENIDTIKTPYAFPVEIDLITNLNSTRDIFSDTERLLEEALLSFNHALSQDENYVKAKINKAIILFLLNRLDEFDNYLYSLKKLQEINVQVQLLEAISEHQKGNLKKSKEILLAIEQNSIAKKNLEKLFQKMPSKRNSKLKIEFGDQFNDLKIPNVQRDFFSHEAKAPDTLDKFLVGSGRQIKLREVRSSDYYCIWISYLKNNAQIRLYELLNIKDIIAEEIVYNPSYFDRIYAFGEKKYCILERKLFIFRQNKLSQVFLY